MSYFTNIVRELQLEYTEGFQEMMRMGFKHFNEILNLIAPDITPQEIISGNKVISVAERLTVVFNSRRNVSFIEFSISEFQRYCEIPSSTLSKISINRRGMIINC